MYKQVDNLIKKYMLGNKERLAVRMPPALLKILETKHQAERVDFVEMDFSDFTRDSIAMAVLPEVLQYALRQETTEWITQQGKNGLEAHFDEKIQRLKNIRDLADSAINKTLIFQDKVNKAMDDFFSDTHIQAEVDYINDVNATVSIGEAKKKGK